MPSVELITIIAIALAAIIGIWIAIGLKKSKKPVAPPPEQLVVEEIKPQIEKAIEPEVKTHVPTWHERLVSGLRRTHGQIFRSLDEILLSKDAKLSREDTLNTLFESLVQADVGVATSELLVQRVREKLPAAEDLNATTVRNLLKTEILALLNSTQPPSATIENTEKSPHVVLVVGVNGVGKTTTTGKLAYKAKLRGIDVAIGAADTFRAAAVDQLRIWAERADAAFVELKPGSDPASVAFESVKVARAQNKKLCLVDTAGRLHNRADLMAELAKVRRVMAKEVPDAPHEVLLVLDATTGQNALQQARVFREIVNITGLVLTKLDGTAKGGIAIAVVNELKIPIRYIGVGESVEDLEPFSPSEFVDALFEN
jgi:fused signal recognition particle receptor